jgi:hypothetical protein
MDAEKPKSHRDGAGTIARIVGFGLIVAASSAYRAGGWPYVLSWVGVAVAVMAVLWLLWRLFRPLLFFLRDEGIVGCWRWVREKVFTPILHGRKGK